MKSKLMVHVSYELLDTTTFQTYPFTIFTGLSIFTHGTLLANNTFISNDANNSAVVESCVYVQ